MKALDDGVRLVLRRIDHDKPCPGHQLFQIGAARHKDTHTLPEVFCHELHTGRGGPENLFRGCTYAQITQVLRH